MDWMSVGCRQGDARSCQGAPPARAGGIAHHPQLPHAALFGEERLRPRPAAALECDELGGRVSLYGEPDKAEARPVHAARQAGEVRAPRSASLPDAAGLVEGLHLDLRAAAGGGSRDRPLDDGAFVLVAPALARRLDELLARGAEPHDE